MSYTNGTPFLNLPQTIGSDHRDWFDTNESFLDLDTKVKTLWDDSGSAASAIDALQELTATLQTDLTTLSGTVDTHTSALSTINEALVLINGTLATLNTSVATKFDSAGIADPYDADHGIYAVGDVVTYNGQRYVCSTAVTAAEPFDADKWTAEDVQTAINDIKSDLSNVGGVEFIGAVSAAGTTHDLSAYREILLTLEKDSAKLDTKIIPIDVLSNNALADLSTADSYWLKVLYDTTHYFSANIQVSKVARKVTFQAAEGWTSSEFTVNMFGIK